MKKYFFLLAVLCMLLPVFIFASPFGLKIGMTLDDITNACNGERPQFMGNDQYFIRPEKNHPLFRNYIVYVDNDIGLYCIRAESDEISTNDYGTEVKNAFNEITTRISKVYGYPKIIDKIAPDSIWEDDCYWTNALAQGARTLMAVWPSTDKDVLSDNIAVITITAKARNEQSGYICLEYQFSNYTLIQNKQDEVF